MAVVLPRAGRYNPKVLLHDWDEARRRLEAEPGEWVLPLDNAVSSGTVSWLRREGPVPLRDIHTEVEWRLRESRLVEGTTTLVGTLYARYTPGQKAAKYPPGMLTDEQVREARERYAAGGVSQYALSRDFGISLAGMNNILRGATRMAAGGPTIPPKEK